VQLIFFHFGISSVKRTEGRQYILRSSNIVTAEDTSKPQLSCLPQDFHRKMLLLIPLRCEW
jgi:hypothetical protein